MAFDDIPEDLEESYPCPECGSSVVKNEYGVWECKECDWCVTPNVEVTGGVRHNKE